jgi:ABC-type antimicrobial peptide transport system permease subunit
VRRQVKAVDPDVPLIESKTMTQHLSLMLFAPRLAALLLGVAGTIALGLSTMGLYAVVAYSAGQRTREVGLRLALGAKRRDVLALVLWESLGLVAVGLALGLGAALAVTRALSALLYGITATDPVTFVAMPLLVAGVALAASLGPARRATRVNPLVALRYE